MAQGVSHKEEAAAISRATQPKSKIGGATRRPGTPAARIAVISPSVDMRVKVIRTATSTPIGTVKGNACGNTSRNKYRTLERGPELRTRNSKSGRARTRKIRNVNSTAHNTAVTTSSRRIVRLSKRMIASLRRGSSIRRRHQRGLLKLVLHRV